jgi:hypothetical protein
MTKDHVRLIEIGECHNGARVWHPSWKVHGDFIPLTIVTQNKRAGYAVVHVGHEFSLTRKKFRIRGWKRTWMITVKGADA